MCTSPNYMSFSGTRDDKEKFSFIGHSDYDKLLHSGVPFVEIPCGKCIECRLQYSRSWADRCVIEAKKYDHNYFVTLTYDDFYLPKNRSLSKSDFKNFIKYLRKLIPNSKIRFFGCGEYGTNPSSGDPGLRPHYHLILFNCPLNDLSFEFYRKDPLTGKMIAHLAPNSTSHYSGTIHRAWNYKGVITVREFAYDSAAYVAQYVMKKVDGELSKKYEDLNITPEFIRMSRMPGIGACGYSDDIVMDDIMIVDRSGNAMKSRPPRYYEKLFRNKYGDEIFFNTISKNHAARRDKSQITYLHSNRIKSLDNKAREYHNQIKFSNNRKV